MFGNLNTAAEKPAEKEAKAPGIRSSKIRHSELLSQLRIPTDEDDDDMEDPEDIQI